MADRLETVVVLGGSVAGILAAAVAARHAERVIVVERDSLAGGGARKGVPQSRHNHNLFPPGLAIMQRLLPGLIDELRASGASVVDSGSEGRFCAGASRLARVETGRLAAFASRPCLDGAMLSRLRATRGVTIRDETDALGLITDAGGARVVGVELASRTDEASQEEIRADLVVDATGRGSRMPAWLGELGCEAPPVEQLEVRVAYATRTFRRRPDDLDGDRYVFVSGQPPEIARGGVAFAVDGDRWMVLLFGYGGVRPPVELDAFRAYAGSLASPDIAELLDGLEPLDDGVTLSYPRATRRRYDEVKSMPRGLLVFGDALVSSNPCWGAGMTSAALQAEVLDRAMGSGRDGLERRFFAGAIAATAPIWESTTQNDVAYDCVPGSAPAPVRWIRAYVGAALRVATTDPVVSRAVRAVIDRAAAPPTLLSPSIVLRVTRGALLRREERLVRSTPAASRILRA